MRRGFDSGLTMATLTLFLILQIFAGAFSFSNFGQNFADGFDGDSFTDLSNDEEMNLNYELLNNVVKRQSKGSCSCTCETKPVSASDHLQGNDLDEGQPAQSSSKQNVVPQILRTALKPYTPTKGANQAQEDKTGTGGATGIMKPLKYARPPAAESLLLSPDIEGVQRPSAGNNWYKTGGIGESRENENGNDNTQKNDEGKKPTTNVQGGGSESWGHGSRFPWKRLPDRICFREKCDDDKDCCLRFNICDRSAKICVDCWYGSACKSEQQCCQKYPYCQIEKKFDREDRLIETGKCVDKL